MQMCPIAISALALGAIVSAEAGNVGRVAMLEQRVSLLDFYPFPMDVSCITNLQIVPD